MNETLQKELATQLANLSIKLGLAAPALWKILVRQVYVNALVGSMWIVLAVILIPLYVRFVHRTCKLYEGQYQWPNSSVFGTIAGGIGVTCLFGFSCWGVGALVAILNPDYAALELLKSLLK